ncbi:hypothetical protein M427DRAFT_132279 [Gonapodya prolifera JEL478]|uniref:Transposase n=1 Tax=Gonapodya prolifera (strain JEL478) TaxID=1344416 RepID=A0A139AR90_GONPJ|nr:hypothetical protein M427DRAFT_132279 [Gonapodya prolifera JEL478]|eukprot:KXS19271.1 hypothetical protein M427DRAFT_132279 [Gonapodya prolifera JEL478]
MTALPSDGPIWSPTGRFSTDGFGACVSRVKMKVSVNSRHHPNHVPPDEHGKKLFVPVAIADSDIVLGVDVGKSEIHITGGRVDHDQRRPDHDFEFRFGQYYERAGINKTRKAAEALKTSHHALQAAVLGPHTEDGRRNGFGHRLHLVPSME